MKTIGLKNWFLYLYYFVLIVVLISWSKDTPPPMVFRMAYLVLFSLPLFFNTQSLLPISLIVFCTVSKFSPYPTYMPTETYIYAVFIGILFFIFQRKGSVTVRSTGLTILIFYTMFVDLLCSGTVCSVSYCLLVLFFLLSFVLNNKKYLQYLSISFSIVTFILSVIFLSSMSEFRVLMDASQNIERVEWTDPNYFGYVVGMGSVCSIISLFQKEIQNKLLRVFFIATVVLSFIVLTLNASRSAILSVLTVTMIVLLFSKVKFFYKILAVLAGSILVYYIYSGGYMDLLMYRVQEGMGDAGGGRMYIWQRKLEAYVSQSNIVKYLFGIGYYDGFSLGYSRGQGFHNDFIAFLVDYGIIGLLLFAIPIIKLLVKSLKTNVYVASTTIYFVLCGLTVEPFTLGVFPYYLFFMYVLSLVENSNKGELVSEINTRNIRNK